MSTPRLVIQDEAHRKRRLLLSALTGALMLIIAVVMYALGRAQGPGGWDSYQVKLQRLQEDRKSLVHDNRELKSENRQLTQKIVSLQRASDVDAAAGGELRIAMEKLQGRLATLQKELAFYRGIVSPQEAQAGVRVQQFTLAPAGREKVYRVDLVLIQSARHDKTVKGQVKIRMDGLREGEAISLTWKDISLDSDDQIMFSFQYFQEIKGTFRVPDNFDPTLMEVEVVPASRGDDAFIDRYDWQDLMQVAGPGAS